MRRVDLRRIDSLRVHRMDDAEICGIITAHGDWLASLSAQIGGSVSLSPDPRPGRDQGFITQDYRA